MSALPLVPAARPSWTQTIPRQVVLALVGSMALAISAQIQVPLWPVPMTFQTLVVLTLGVAYGPRLGAATVGVYLAQGAVGLPVFAGFSAGAAILTGTTAGYLVGFVVAAAVTGFLTEQGWHQHWLSTMAAMVVGNVIIIALGFGWLATIIGPAAAWTSGVVPFLIGDVIKIAIAVAALPAIARRVGSHH